jgi:hypothetical protein
MQSKAEVKTTIDQVLRKALQEAFPSDGSETARRDMDIVAQLCIMGMVPTGEEDPKQLVSRLSDTMVRNVVSRMSEIQKNPVVGRVCQLFLIEWCQREGYLNGDWAWEWDSSTEGHVSYNPKIPLSSVPLPSPAASAYPQ